MEILRSIYEVAWFVLIVAAGIAAIEGYFFYHFKLHDRKWFMTVSVAAFPLAAVLACRWLGRSSTSRWSST